MSVSDCILSSTCRDALDADSDSFSPDGRFTLFFASASDEMFYLTTNIVEFCGEYHGTVRDGTRNIQEKSSETKCLNFFAGKK